MITLLLLQVLLEVTATEAILYKRTPGRKNSLPSKKSGSARRQTNAGRPPNNEPLNSAGVGSPANQPIPDDSSRQLRGIHRPPSGGIVRASESNIAHDGGGGGGVQGPVRGSGAQASTSAGGAQGSTSTSGAQGPAPGRNTNRGIHVTMVKQPKSDRETRQEIRQQFGSRPFPNGLMVHEVGQRHVREKVVNNMDEALAAVKTFRQPGTTSGGSRKPVRIFGSGDGQTVHVALSNNEASDSDSDSSASGRG